MTFKTDYVLDVLVGADSNLERAEKSLNDLLAKLRTLGLIAT